MVDLRRKEVVVFNDRYGMQRLYYHAHNDTTIFASEAKSLLMLRPELRNLDPKGVSEFLTCGCGSWKIAVYFEELKLCPPLRPLFMRIIKKRANTNILIVKLGNRNPR